MRGRIPKDRGNLAMERVSKDYALCLTAVWSKLLSQTGRSAFGSALGFGIARWAYRCVAQPLRLRRGEISGDGNKRYAEHTGSTGMHSEQHCSHSPIICSTLNRFLRIPNPPISRPDLVEDQHLLWLRNDGDHDGFGNSEGRTLSVRQASTSGR